MAALLDAIGVALVDFRMQSSTPAVVPGAALPRPRLGRVGGYVIMIYYAHIVTVSVQQAACFFLVQIKFWCSVFATAHEDGWGYL